MNFAEKNALIGRANERRTGISDEKGPEYTGEADSYRASDANILTNFYVRAERAKASVFTIAQTYAGKHIDSIETALSELAKAGSIAARLAIVRKGEGLISRLDDLRNYCDLLECILMEEGIHPEKLDMVQIQNYELLETARLMDWGVRTEQVENDGTFDSKVGQVTRGEGFDGYRANERDTLRLKSAGECIPGCDPGDCTCE